MDPAPIDLESIIRTLYDETSFQRDLDARLCDVLATILPDIKRHGLIARFGGEQDLLHYVTDGEKAFENIQTYSDFFDRKLSEAGEKSRNYYLGSPSDILLVDLALAVRDEHGKTLRGTSISNYCVFFGAQALASDFIKSVTDEPLTPADHRSYLDFTLISYGINYALRYRKKIFSNFPMALNKEYWATEVMRPLNLMQAERRPISLRPPWMGDGKRRTATLSLDMRRSTFAMDQSTDSKAYADWIEAFVLILQRVAQENFGIFDKFTGDGVLVHFLADECRRFAPVSAEQTSRIEKNAGWRTEMSSTGQYATRWAVKCGFEMIWAVEYHMTRLKQILGIDNAHIGPVVGIAIDQAQWSVDREGGLIVVGRGLVQACRVTNEVKKGRMRLTAHAAQMLREVHGPIRAEASDFRSKEFPDGSGVTAEELEHAPSGLCRRLDEVHAVVEDVWADLDRRSSAIKHQRFG